MRGYRRISDENIVCTLCTRRCRVKYRFSDGILVCLKRKSVTIHGVLFSTNDIRASKNSKGPGGNVIATFGRALAYCGETNGLETNTIHRRRKGARGETDVPVSGKRTAVFQRLNVHSSEHAVR